MTDAINADIIQNIIRNSTEPLVFHNLIHDWKILTWDLYKWCEKLGQTELMFRLGKFGKSKDPQWGKHAEKVCGTFKEFLEFENKDDWLYFDYKYLKEWLENFEELKQDIKWNIFGLKNLNYKDSTIWIGNKGAHTPCHIDTYGYNLVAQIYGQKQWLLFPKNEDLLPTRIPYEESSIYSKLNFFSPNYEQLKGINECRNIILNPGDVLFVPQGWWHYVENLEVAISINTWIPLKDDVSRQIEEAFVQLLISQALKDLNTREADNILLTNSDNEKLLKSSIQDSAELLHTCIHSYEDYVKDEKLNCDKMKFNINLDNYLINYAKYVNQIPVLTQDEFKTLILEKSERFPPNNDIEEAFDKNCKITKILEAITHPDVVQLIKRNFLKE